MIHFAELHAIQSMILGFNYGFGFGFNYGFSFGFVGFDFNYCSNIIFDVKIMVRHADLVDVYIQVVGAPIEQNNVVSQT